MDDIEATVAMSFRLLEFSLAQAIEIIPVTDIHQLARLIPDAPKASQRLILSELIKLDMTKAGERGEHRTLNFYEGVLKPMFGVDPVPLDLVIEEMRIARQLGKGSESSQLAIQYPELAEKFSTQVPRTPMRNLRPPELQIGQIVEDFQILRRLGAGGFASVYLARQLSMERLVALKVSATQSDEPIALSQLDHPNVVRVFDQRHLTNSTTTLLYMQYVAGGTLADVISGFQDLPPSQRDGAAMLRIIDSALLKAGQQTPEQSPVRQRIEPMELSRLVAWIGIELSQGLSAAHAAGVMHRDIKPANILMSAEGIPKLADFNVSFASMIQGSGASAHFGGSLAYMSPEQLQAADPTLQFTADQMDERSDIYSLAIVLWELWQGRRPATTPRNIDSWHSSIKIQLEMREQIPLLVHPITTSSEKVLEKTLRQALSLDRDRRPQTASQLAGGLKLALNPVAAEYFEPVPDSWRAFVLQLPVLLVTAIIIFIPNGITAVLNYQFNRAWIAADHPEILDTFVRLSIGINWISFPLGVACLLWKVWPVQLAVQQTLLEKSRLEDSSAMARRPPASDRHLQEAWNLGHSSAMIGGLLWMAAGIAFPVAINLLSTGISIQESLQFFLSLVICGGFAWIYPFFGISLISTSIYFPALIAPRMVDPFFGQRAERLQVLATRYLGTAAAIPLLALGLLTMNLRGDVGGSDFLLVVVMLTGIALPFAFFAHQRLIENTKILGSILTNPK